ncbi:polymer-forming cytoskeletal protein [bacterium]|nr:polymer-forming cytoskeletal protein [bacterium]
MCDVAYFTGSTETVIPGSQITAFKFPQEQMTYNWQPSRGVLHMSLPTPSSGGSDVAVTVGANTYPAGSFDQITHHYSTSSQVGTHLNIYPVHNVYLAGDGLSLYYDTIANTPKSPAVQIGGETLGPTQVTTVAYDSTFSYSTVGTQLTLTAGTTGIPNGSVTGGVLTVAGTLTANILLQSNGDISCAGTVTSNVTATSELILNTSATVNGSLTCDSLTVTSGLPGGSLNFDQYTGSQDYIDAVGGWNQHNGQAQHWNLGGNGDGLINPSWGDGNVDSTGYEISYQMKLGTCYCMYMPRVDSGDVDVVLEFSDGGELWVDRINTGRTSFSTLATTSPALAYKL